MSFSPLMIVKVLVELRFTNAMSLLVWFLIVIWRRSSTRVLILLGIKVLRNPDLVVCFVTSYGCDSEVLWRAALWRGLLVIIAPCSFLVSVRALEGLVPLTFFLIGLITRIFSKWFWRLGGKLVFWGMPCTCFILSSSTLDGIFVFGTMSSLGWSTRGSTKPSRDFMIFRKILIF